MGATLQRVCWKAALTIRLSLKLLLSKTVPKDRCWKKQIVNNTNRLQNNEYKFKVSFYSSLYQATMLNNSKEDSVDL